MISSDNPGIVALFAQANAPLNRLLVNKFNFNVLKVTPTSDPELNTLVEIRVDRTIDIGGGTIPLPEGEERYFERAVQLHRFNIAEVLAAQSNEDGEVQIAGWTNPTDAADAVDEFRAGFAAAHFTNDDIVVTPTPVVGVYVITAKPNSIGYHGRAQVTVVDEVPAP